MNRIEVIEKTLPQDVNAAYDQIREGALLQIRSLKSVRSRAKLTSNILRAFAFVFLSVGIILPVLLALFRPLFEKPASSDLSAGFDPLAFGYMAIAIGGLCTLADQVFGFSQKHDRIRSLEMRLVALLRDLDFGWNLRRVAVGVPATVDPAKDLKSLYDFRRLVDEAIATQVAEWIAQRQQGHEILSNRLAAAQPRNKSGS